MRLAYFLSLLPLHGLVVGSIAFQPPISARHIRPAASPRGRLYSNRVWYRRKFNRRRIQLSSMEVDSADIELDDQSAASKNRTEGIETTNNVADKANKETPSFRDCLSFALPALGIYACPPLMSLIDASFIGRSSSLELAALGPASSISDSAPLPLLFLSIGSTNLIARAFSHNDNATLSKVSRTALGMGAICGTILAVGLYLGANPISILYCGGSNSLAPPCTRYVAIRALALPFVVLSTIAQAISIGTKDSRTPMISVSLAGVLNLVGDLVLVKYMKQGIAGAAWATSMSQVMAAVLLLRVLKKRGFLQSQKQFTNNNNEENAISTVATVKQLLSFVPFLFIMMVKIFWHNSCAATAASLGGAKAAAHTALLSVAMLCFLLGDAGSSLAQAFLPTFLRTKDDTRSTSESNHRATDNETTVPASSSPESTTTFDLDAAMPTIRQLLKCTLTISTAAVAVASTVIGIFGGQITSDPSVLAEMKKTLPWLVTALSFHGSAVTLEGILLVRKKFPALSLCYTLLALTVAAFQVATKQFNLGLTGVWGCYVWFCASRVVTFSALAGLLRPKKWFSPVRERIRPHQVKTQTT